MRTVLALSLAAGAFLMTQGVATAAPLALSDHAAVTQKLAGSAAEPVARRYVRKRRRRCGWQCTPYWRPYQYYYWQHYYPYGGPLF